MEPTELIAVYQETRRTTEHLCSPLITEDYGVQGMEDVSPPKWQLAHSSWFFETCILKQNADYQLYNPMFHQLFNSYYQLLGIPFPRPQRGLLSRPSVKDVYQYRHYIDEQIVALLKQTDKHPDTLIKLIELGIHHEQQHQELLLMDVQFNFSLNPLFPAYQLHKPQHDESPTAPLNFIKLNPAIADIGTEEEGFCFDNEQPKHKKIIIPCAIADRLITNEEYVHFIEDGGYKNPGLWLADGWDWCHKNHITMPLYWYYQDNSWFQFSLCGLHPIDMKAPVAHVSFYEADAYARWTKARLPTEEEWEYHVKTAGYKSSSGNFLEQGALIPQPKQHHSDNPHQFFGDLWEWTSSAYAPYPQYKPFKGMVGEYNGKFMNNQRVLRGGACITPQSHIRATYRNFFQPDKRWHFCGIRLIKDEPGGQKT
jgi:ergothioneine biosynthesis protein EgtB